MKTHLLPLVALIIGASPLNAAAQSPGASPATIHDEATSDWRPGFGAHVGGYGFRAADADDGLTWFDCRMDGVGLLGTLDMGEHLFVELSVDFYQATEDVVTEGHMDRVSLLTFGSVGLRMAPDWIISPFIQLGVGAEWTRLTMLGGADLQDLYPTAFMGAGAEYDLTEQLKLGVGLRFLAMAHPDHTHEAPADDHGHGLGASPPDPAIPMSFSPAAQGIGWLRYTL